MSMNKSKPQIFSWMNPKLEIVKTEKYGKVNLPTLVENKKVYKTQKGDGFAVIAKFNLKKNEVLFVMGGYILSIEDENQLSGIIADKPIEVSEEFSIGPRKP